MGWTEEQMLTASMEYVLGIVACESIEADDLKRRSSTAPAPGRAGPKTITYTSRKRE